MNSMVPPGVTSSSTCAEFGVSACRSMIPAFAHCCVFWIAVTRATTCTSPEVLCDTYWNESVVSQMSAPAPATVNTPFDDDALPVSPVDPTSWFVHGEGRLPDPDAALVVVNDQTGPVVLPPLLFATICQK